MYTGMSVPYSLSLNPNDYQLTQYEYDDYGNLLILTDALNYTETYTYDDNGMLATLTDRNGNQFRYIYNALGNIIEDSVYDLQGTPLMQKTYVYTKTGALRSVSEGGVILTYAYDEGGRNISVTETGNILREYEYDNFGNMTLFRLKVTGVVKSVVTYGYDKMFRLTTVTENGDTTTYTYDANGNRATMDMSGCDSLTEYGYNDANLVTSMTNYADSVKVSEFTYSYYTDGNQRVKTDTVNGTSTTYVYDGAGRLMSETEIDTTLLTIIHKYQYLYKSTNNRWFMSVDGSEDYSVVYTYDKNNRLLTETKIENGVNVTTTYTYDANSNTLTATTGNDVITYTYNCRDQQISWSDGTDTVTYTYNLSGLRASKTNSFVLRICCLNSWGHYTFFILLSLIHAHLFQDT
jgi:YD repeat-containing protein